MNEQHLVNDELIGRTVTVRDCADPNWKDVTGIIRDETKQTFLIETGQHIKRIAKRIATFEFEQNGETLRIEGARLCFRSEDRIKKAR